MKLNANGLKDRDAWVKAGYALPKFDRDEVARNTAKDPEWVHFGAGNIFRAFPAALQQTLLDKGLVKTGIVVAEAFDTEIIEKAYAPFDGLSVLVTLKANGSIEKTVISSVVESLVAKPGTAGWARLEKAFVSPSLQMASFTITEKGYSLPPRIAGTLETPVTIMEMTAALCHSRYRSGARAITLVSMDNCSHNGQKLQDAILAIAERWHGASLVDGGFLAYLKDPRRVAFPWSMIDKITPRPDDSVRELLEKDGYESAGIIVTDKKTYTASFVNAEETEYLVIEDAFANGRAPLEKAGVIFTDRSTVDRVEKMKVCTCLNPLHTSLAIFGCLLSYTSIHREMKDKELTELIKRVGYDEGLPVVVDPGILDPREFIDVVINTRLPNPFMPDTPQRIACDTSLKIPIRFGETIKAYLANPKLDAKGLTYIPLVIAGWCRYLMGIDDDGKAFEPSPDPNLEKLKAHVAGISLGAKGTFHDTLKPILSDSSIFAVNLYDAGLGDKIEAFFAELVAGPGAVRATLRKYLK